MGGDVPQVGGLSKGVGLLLVPLKHSFIGDFIAPVQKRGEDTIVYGF